jgi:RNA polymerase sigma-70 factor (ECF subfamily)
MSGPVPDDAAGLAQERAQIEQAQAGDHDALKPILKRYGPVLFSGVILPRLGNEADAEDVLRDTMMAAIDRIQTFRWKDRSIYFWMRQIALNKIIDVHRKRQRGDRLVNALAAEAAVDPPYGEQADEALIAAQERKINRERITRTLKALNPRYAEAIRLRLMEELPRRNCAARMGVTLGTFDVLFFRSVKSFRKKFLEQ